MPKDSGEDGIVDGANSELRFLGEWTSTSVGKETDESMFSRYLLLVEPRGNPGPGEHVVD